MILPGVAACRSWPDLIPAGTPSPQWLPTVPRTAVGKPSDAGRALVTGAVAAVRVTACWACRRPGLHS